MRKIGNVIINLEYYNGIHEYSDGDIEDEILEIVKSERDYREIISSDNRWPILYHLSPIRRQLLEWTDLFDEKKILEIGAGCGAMTGLLCERGKRVVAIELSKRRAEIIAHRCSQQNNLEVVVGNFNDIKIESRSFDIVTLIGVLEYAGKFTEENHPYQSFLKKVADYICENGYLVIAIENKFGLKYWSGAREDHTGRFFDSIEGYPNQDKVKTFSKDELSNLLYSAGYDNLQYYYPTPDYKMPNQIFSDDYLPGTGQIKCESPNYDAEKISLFNEQKAFDQIILNRRFDFFANSFLVVCQKKKGAFI